MLQVNYYKTNLGLFFSLSSSFYTNFRSYRINGIPFEQLEKVSNNWYRIADDITSITNLVTGKSVLVGWQRVYSSKVIPAWLPETLTTEQLTVTYTDDDDDPVYAGEYAEVAAFYQPVYKQADPMEVPVEYTLHLIREIEIDSYEAPAAMQVTIINDNNNKRTEVDLSSIVSYDDFDTIVVPEFLLYKRPCMLTSRQMYDIVRTYIKDNIDRAVATITSDYNFCFTVKKIIKCTPYMAQETHVGARGKTVTHTQRKETKQVEVFEMTYSGYKGASGYEGYTCIDPWYAESFQDMKDGLGKYLKDLMLKINTPAVECPHCQGAGIVDNNIGTNSR